MSYVGDMTNVILDEIDAAERLLKYSDDLAYGIWFKAKAVSKLEELESDFEYYVEVTEIRKKANSDRLAAEMYKYMTSRIDTLKKTQACGKIEK